MRPLIDYIIEKRGIVSGEYSWDVTVDTIMDYMGNIEVGLYEIDEDKLPSWMIYLIVEIIESGQASYEFTKSKIMDGKLDGYIKIPLGKNKDWYKSALNHELQHAFDDWIARTRRGKQSGFDDKYCIATGYEYNDLGYDKLYELVTNPSKCDFDYVFNILKETTYALNESEVNAYLREFYIYVEGLQSGNWDFNNILKHADNGMVPLICLNCLYGLKHNINILDISDEDWEYVSNAVNEKWTKMYLGHIVKGSGKETILKIVNEIFKVYGKNIVKRYYRVLLDHGLKPQNEPEWFK